MILNGDLPLAWLKWTDPSMKPLAASVAYFTVLHVMVDSLSDTPSGSGDAACAIGLKRVER
jgi:hypothetical protein